MHVTVSLCNFFIIFTIACKFGEGTAKSRDLSHPDKITYKNQLFPSSGWISGRRRWYENQRAYFFCPQNSFIERVTYNFGTSWALRKDWEYRGVGDRPKIENDTQYSMNVVEPNSTSRLAFKRYNRNITEEHASKHSIPQCIGLLHCIGHQACLFKVSVEFCGIDEYPHSNREVLDVVFQCTRDSHFHGSTRASQTLAKSVAATKNKVLHMTWEEHPSKPDTVLLHKRYLEEEEIFGIDCPKVEDASKYGYAGVCTHRAPSQEAIVQEIWHKVARANHSECRKELLQAYCAYKYNSSGGCVPPALVRPLSPGSVQGGRSWGFSFKSLPYPGKRPDMQIHNQITSHPSSKLIPARIAFSILVHKSPDTVIHLLETLYRNAHYFVIHVDKRQGSVRTELIWKIIKTFGLSENIRVLPAARSFATSWGSYEIIRAELECLEELIRMGPWDFAIDLSGADLPLRNVDDISATLASVRGRTFFRANINGRWKSWQIPQPKFRSVWYSCDCHVFNISYRAMPDQVDMYSASQWTILSREASEFVVSPDREGLHEIQFFTQSSLIPDESYLKSTIMMSHLRDTVVGGNLHTFQNFAQNDEKGFCRHSEDIDFCGQGPLDFKDGSLYHLKSQSYTFMFGRKFDDNVTSQLRGELAKWREGGFYDQVMEDYMKQDFLNLLVQSALNKKYGYQWYKVMHKPVIKEWRLLPVIQPTDPCCQAVFNSRNELVQKRRIWIDFEVTQINGPTTRMRASFMPKKQYDCFCQGHLKALQVLGVNKFGGRGIENPPHPYDLAIGKYLHIRAQFKQQGKPCKYCNEVANMKKMNKQYENVEKDNFRFVFIGKNKTLKFQAHIFGPSGKLQCHRILTFDWSARKHYGPEDAQYLVSSISCSELRTGSWTLTLHQLGVVNPFPYTTKIHLVKRKWFTDNTKEHLYGLWNVEDMMEMPLQASFYDIYKLGAKSGVDEQPTTHEVITVEQPDLKIMNVTENEKQETQLNMVTKEAESGLAARDKSQEYTKMNRDEEQTVAKQQPRTAAMVTVAPLQPQILVDGTGSDGSNKNQDDTNVLRFTMPTERDDFEEEEQKDHHGNLKLNNKLVQQFEKEARMHNIQRRFLVAASQMAKPKESEPEKLDNPVVVIDEKAPLNPSVSNIGLKLGLVILSVILFTKGVLVPLKIVKLERRDYRGIFLVFITVAAIQSILYTYAQLK
ncbi:uncharacterized protein [Ptychodera flava]|uniref:uncharacterized protein n=1 Tax=Ptychodera flava TaxID=63121 RepID=UPI00396A911A